MMKIIIKVRRLVELQKVLKWIRDNEIDESHLNIKIKVGRD